jgi:hypothetical protein
MAKPRRKERSKVKASKIPRDPVTVSARRKMIAKLKAYHALGRQLKNEKASLEQVSREKGIHVTALYKARAFARQYNRQQLRQLCSLRRSNSLPLHWGYIPILLTVSNARERNKLQALAAAEDWSVNKLIDEIKNRFPGERRQTESGKKGGRPPSAARKEISERFAKISRTLESLLNQPGRSTNDKRALREIASEIEEIEKRIRWFAVH